MKTRRLFVRIIAERLVPCGITLTVVGMCVCDIEVTYALEKYGRPLPSLDNPNADREEEESLFGG